MHFQENRMKKQTDDEFVQMKCRPQWQPGDTIMFMIIVVVHCRIASFPTMFSHLLFGVKRLMPLSVGLLPHAILHETLCVECNAMDISATQHE